MLGILIDAAVLVALIKAVNAQDVDFLTAIIIAVVASVGTGLVAVGLGALMGVAGLVLAAIVGAVVVGFAVSVFVGMEFKRACLVGAIFVAVHLGVSFGSQAAFGG